MPVASDAAVGFDGKSLEEWTSDKSGEWNTIEVICNADQFEHYVNGHLVNSGTRASVRRGRILLQSEGAEVWYRNVEIRPF